MSGPGVGDGGTREGSQAPWVQIYHLLTVRSWQVILPPWAAVSPSVDGLVTVSSWEGVASW